MNKERYELRYVGDWYCYVYDNEKQQGTDICSLDDSVRIFNEQDKKIKDLETKLADLQQEQIKEMQEHQEAMELADKTINNLVEDNRASQEWYKKQLAESESRFQAHKQNDARIIQDQTDLIENLRQQLDDTEEQNKRVLEKLELIVSANQELEQKLAEKDKEIITLNCVISEIHSDLKELQEFKVGDDEYDLTDSDARFSLECELLNKDQDKISFAVEQLEKVKEWTHDNASYVLGDFASVWEDALLDEINNQINVLRNNKDGIH